MTLRPPVPLPSPAQPPLPYDEQPAWSEMWQACVAVLDRYPHLRTSAAPSQRAVQRVRIPQAAVDAADRHFHLD